MTEKISFLGIQMDCTPNPLDNAAHIAEAIIKNPNCDYAITPECALSGYTPNWQTNYDDALQIVLDAAKETQTGVFLGTISKGNQTFNNCLVVNKQGKVVNEQAKSQIIPWDKTLGCKPAPITTPIELPDHPGLTAGVMICNDFWGGPMMDIPCLPTQYCTEGGANILIHCTNGSRGNGELHDQIYWDWHKAFLQMVSKYHMIPVISVDNSCHMTGEPYRGRTSSPSGCWVTGEKIAGVPDFGQHNFIADIPISVISGDPWDNIEMVENNRLKDKRTGEYLP